MDDGRGVVLLVDDDAAVLPIVRHYFSEHWKVRMAYTAREGMAAVRVIENLRLALIDLNLPDSDYSDRENPRGGFDVIRAARTRFPRSLVLVFSAHINAWTVNTAARFGAEVLGKEDFQDNFSMLVKRLLAMEQIDSVSSKALTGFAEAHSLTDRQVEVLATVLRYGDRSEAARRLDISVNTVKTHIANILRRTGLNGIGEIRRQLFYPRKKSD